MTIPRAAAVVTAAPLFLLGVAAPAAADVGEDSAGQTPISFDMTMVSVPDEYTSPPYVDREATLECLPAGGTHPSPAESCRTLIQVGGDFEELPLQPGVCAQYWDPVLVTVEGHWFDERVSFEAQYSNPGCAAAASDRIFGF
jgi:hypothetical protein